MHPELNLVNRYRTHISIRRQWVNRAKEEDPAGDSDDDQDAAASADKAESPFVPFVIPGAKSSFSNNLVQTIRFPVLTRNKAHRLFSHVGETNQSPRVFSPLLGPVIVKRNNGRPNWFDCIGTHSAVQIGPWKFKTMDEEDPFQSGTSHCYFAIRAKWVAQRHHYFEANPVEALIQKYDPEELYYGRFHRFVKLTMHMWDEVVHFLGECSLWKAQTHQPLSKLAVIDWTDNLKGLNASGRKVGRVEWIPLKHIETICAVGPVVTGWANRTDPTSQDKIIVSRKLYVVMPLQL